MACWSIKRHFRDVTAADFREAVHNLQGNLAETGIAADRLSITFYQYARNATHNVGVDWHHGGLNRQLGAVRPFATVGNVRGVTADLWRQADYVQAVLEPASGFESASVEAKGLHPRQITFAVSPDKPGEAVKRAGLDYFALWRHADGVSSNRRQMCG